MGSTSLKRNKKNLKVSEGKKLVKAKASEGKMQVKAKRD
jgi:hypothetical protein